MTEFASDALATKVITGLLGGMTAAEIRRHYGLSTVEYDTARRRIRRTMLRHGLTWSWP
jgi:RNA polymerase sigma-70 factor (ECF subfamily)